MKKVLLTAYCALFIGICAFFSLGTLIPGASQIAEKDVTAPKLFTAPPFVTINSDYGTEFEEYFQKSFAYRNKVVDAFSLLKSEVFSEGNEQVIVGKDDFLFFADTLSDYTGSEPMTDEEINRAADALLRMYEYSKERGASFLFVCAPNKSSVYPEMMPARYIPSSDISNLDRLYSRLDELNIPYLDIRPVLAGAKDSFTVYHKRDTHWNNEGARVAFEAIADVLDFTVPDYSQYGPTEVCDHKGDLDTLLFPTGDRLDDNTAYDFTGLYVYTTAYSNPMDIRIATRGGGSGRLLMFRDSFANALIPFAASAFSEVRFERASPYAANIEILDSFNADFVVAEIAERNLRDLIIKENTDSDN